MEAPLTEQNVRRIVLAVFQGEAPGSFRLRLALKEMEKIQEEMVEEVSREMEQYYRQQTGGDP